MEIEQTVPVKRTRVLGELRWYRCTQGSAEVCPVQSDAFADVLAAEAWLKKALADETVTPAVFELHRVVKRVEPKAVVVPQRFEW